MSNNMLCNLWQWGVVSRKPTICTRGRQRAEENGFRELSVFSSLVFCTMKTLPKAQRTRGLSSSYQSNFLRSYHELKHKS